jgi:hypothetical protein
MERRMMLGVKERAEGGIRPAWRDVAEVATWLSALAVAAVAAALALGLAGVPASRDGTPARRRPPRRCGRRGRADRLRPVP